MNKTRRIVRDPITPIKIHGIGTVSIVDLYLKDRDLYLELCNPNNIYDVTIPEEIKFFLRNVTTRKKAPKSARKDYVSQWKKHVEYRSARAKREKNKENELLYVREIIKDTTSGVCVWREDLNTVSTGIHKQRYSTSYMDKVFKLSIVSYKNKDGETKVNTELQEEIGEGVVTFPRDLNAKLYGEIKKKISENAPTKKELNKLSKGPKREQEITKGDFVVRTNLFRCYHENHEVEEIIGLLKIALPTGKIFVEKVPGAYCEKCHCFFMSVSEYVRVKKKGVLLCQLIDHDEYHRHGKLMHFDGASESILMRNGYNVKAIVGLTDEQRQAILCHIIDNKIMSPYYIVSYLNTFIAQKKYQQQYQNAVDKWSRDREFVLSYENANKRTVEIQSIYKK